MEMIVDKSNQTSSEQKGGVEHPAAHNSRIGMCTNGGHAAHKVAAYAIAVPCHHTNSPPRSPPTLSSCLILLRQVLLILRQLIQAEESTCQRAIAIDHSRNDPLMIDTLQNHWYDKVKEEHLLCKGKYDEL